jgi:hypothetical protein
MIKRISVRNKIQNTDTQNYDLYKNNNENAKTANRICSKQKLKYWKLIF